MFIPLSGYSFVEKHYGFKRFPVGIKHLERNTSHPVSFYDENFITAHTSVLLG